MDRFFKEFQKYTMNPESKTKTKLSKMSSYFLTLTTLHGFKYLHSPYKLDKFMWTVSCVASAACAAVLCSVLWTRFVRNSVLLTVGSDLPHTPEVIAVCQTNMNTAITMFRSMDVNESYSKSLAHALSRTLERRKTHQRNLQMADALLHLHNMTVKSALLKYAPPCNQLVKKCRWNGLARPCDTLFHLKWTDYGACCVMNSSTEQRCVNGIRSYIIFNYTLSIVVNCSTKNKLCKFFMEHTNKEDEEVMSLLPGLEYFAVVKFSLIQDRTTENVVKRKCEDKKYYSRQQCLLKCAERVCGCSSFLTDNETEEEFRPCSLTEYSCLWKISSGNPKRCTCPRNCNEANIMVNLHAIPLNSISTAVDPFYYGINANDSIIINTWTSKVLSQSFIGISTDSWLTLLSSLGGVFNMFLGVGLFTALEFVYFLIIRIPVMVRRSGDITNTTIRSPTVNLT